MRAVDIVTKYRPGSHDPPWTWADEAKDCMGHDNWSALVHSISTFGYVEAMADDPVMIGKDGRVWDGHHRIIAMLLTHPLVDMPVSFPAGATW